MSPSPATAAASTRTRDRARRGGHSPRVARRVSGPVRPRPVFSGGAVALPRPVGPPPPLRRALRRLAALPDHRLLARLVHGSAWIGIVGFALIGIVFMQVSLLKLNAGIAQSVADADALDRENSQLRADISAVEGEGRIAQAAQAAGLIQPPAGEVTYLDARGADATKAVRAVKAPDPLRTAQVEQAWRTAAAPATAAGGTPQQPQAQTPTVAATPQTTSQPQATTQPTTQTTSQPQTPAVVAQTATATTATPAQEGR